MRIKRPSRLKGVTLVEVVLSVIILSVSLGGLYTGLMSASKYLFEPEQILESVNIVQYYQSQIETLEPADICQGQTHTPIEQLFCSPEKQQHIVIHLNDEIQWAKDKTLEIHVEEILNTPKVYQVKFDLYKADQTLYVAQMLKVAP